MIPLGCCRHACVVVNSKYHCRIEVSSPDPSINVVSTCHCQVQGSSLSQSVICQESRCPCLNVNNCRSGHLRLFIPVVPGHIDSRLHVSRSSQSASHMVNLGCQKKTIYLTLNIGQKALDIGNDEDGGG